MRARQAQLEAWIATVQPDVLCLQEIKASRRSCRRSLCEVDGLLVLLARREGLFGRRALLCGATLAPERPAFVTSGVRFRERGSSTARLRRTLTVASVYVPNGGKDFDGEDALPRGARGDSRPADAARRQPLVICGDLNVARTDTDIHPKERKLKQIGAASRRARAASNACSSHGLVDVGRAIDPEDDGLFTWWAPWRNMRQRNIGWRIDYVLASAGAAARAASLRRRARGRHQRPRPGDGDVLPGMNGTSR